MFTTALTYVVALLAGGGAALVQPAPGCRTDEARIAANKLLVRQFYESAGAAKAALIHPNYIQHDPAFVKRQQANGTSARDEIVAAITNSSQPAPVAGQQPGGRQIVILMAECDLVNVVVRRVRPDPHTPGRTYELYTFDVFRIRDGKLFEHWDGVDLNRAPGAPE